MLKKYFIGDIIMKLEKSINKHNKEGTIWSNFEQIYHHHFLPQFLQWQLNDMVRGKKIITIASIEIIDSQKLAIEHKAIESLANMISSQVRNNDFVFSSEQQGKFYVLFTYSGIREVQFFINRLEKKFEHDISQFNSQYYLTKGLVEITDGNFNIDRILNEVDYVHSVAMLNEQQIEFKVLKNNETNTVLKVAIVDSNELSHAVLENSLNGLSIPQTTFEISHYYSGESYLKSEIYRSSNLQLVLISDILPERDGIEVLQQLRSLPNESKYFVIVLGSRNTEEETIYAMEQGADDYIAKPFNVKLLAVKIKRLLKRGI